MSLMSVVLEKQRKVLRFKDAVLTTDPYARTVSEALNLEVCAGELFLIRLGRSDQIASFADVCNGTIHPLSGSIFFLGKDWRYLSPDVANALRGRTGHVFFTGNWTQSLSVVENILTPQLYHTRNSRAQLLDQAGHLAESFGLPGLPRGLPGDFTAADLQRAACVRAFLGRPLLVLLQEPTRGLEPDILGPLIQAIREARYRGAAVIWLTKEKEIWKDATIPTTQRYHLVARNLMEEKL
jgi:phospholipid/cholesterol/gamma-HCH transport system ATP-binding protein